MKTLKDFNVNLTNSQRKKLNSSKTMSMFRHCLREGETLENVFCDHSDAMGWDTVTIQTNITYFKFIITPRGRIVEEKFGKIK